MNEPEICQVDVWEEGRWPTSHPCGRKVKEDGLCGVHLRSKRLREEKTQKFYQERSEGDRNAERARELSEKLSDFGVEASVDYQPGQGDKRGKYTGGVVVANPEKLLELLGNIQNTIQENEQ